MELSVGRGETLVKDFMSTNVVSVYSHSNVTKAIKAMAENNIGSVVVVDSNGPKGVFTERDLLSKVLARGREPEGLVLTEVLSPLFVAIDSDATLRDAARTMVERRSRLMVFDGELDGIVTATDIVRSIQLTRKRLDLSGVISRRVATELPETPLSIVVQDMNDRGIGSVLVTEDGRPYGIFTERDLLLKVLTRGVGLGIAVGELVSVPLITAPIKIDGRDAAGMMATRHIKRLPLKKGDEVAAIVTARDLVEAFARSD